MDPLINQSTIVALFAGIGTYFFFNKKIKKTTHSLIRACVVTIIVWFLMTSMSSVKDERTTCITRLTQCKKKIPDIFIELNDFS